MGSGYSILLQNYYLGCKTKNTVMGKEKIKLFFILLYMVGEKNVGKKGISENG